MNINDCCYMIRQLYINVYNWIFNIDTNVDQGTPYMNLNDFELDLSETF